VAEGSIDQGGKGFSIAEFGKSQLLDVWFLPELAETHLVIG